MKKILQFLVAVSVFVGFRLCSKDSFHDKYKEEFLSSCGEDEKCIEFADSKKWESCFEDSFTLGRRSTFNESSFMSCAGFIK